MEINNILFIHIPKTGGMTIEAILKKYDYNEMVPRVFLRKYKSYELLKDKYSYINRNSKYHYPITFYKKNLEYKFKRDKMLFTIVRNPYYRIISDFRFWISEFCPNHKNSEKKHMLELVKDVESIIPDLILNKETLNKFIHHVLDDKNFNFSMLDGHLIPMHLFTHSFVFSRYQSHCTILRFEHLTKDFNNFIRKVNLKIPENSTDSIFRNVSRGPKFTINDLDPLSMKLIQEKYALDFKLFNYPM